MHNRFAGLEEGSKPPEVTFADGTNQLLKSLYTVFEREREVRVRCVWVEVRGLEI
jgi:hypothetical protein